MKKTIFITGSTDGIGKLAAIKLAQDGHQLYLHGRNAEKLPKVISEIKAETNNDAIGGFVADFSDLEAVKEMAHHIIEEVPQLDVLINNAGIYKSRISHNAAGQDIRYAVNYFAPYLLTTALLPLLRKGTAPRILNLSSAAQSSISYETMKGTQRQSEQATYAQSKLALTMWSFDLAKKLEGITVFAINPGSLLNTNMVREAFGRFWSPADKGGNIIYDLAVSDKYAGMTGKYFDNDQGSFGQAHADAYNEAEIDKLIRTTANMLT